MEVTACWFSRASSLGVDRVCTRPLLDRALRYMLRLSLTTLKNSPSPVLLARPLVPMVKLRLPPPITLDQSTPKLSLLSRRISRILASMRIWRGAGPSVPGAARCGQEGRLVFHDDQVALGRGVILP
jgi:hypothetical protein